MFNAVKKPVVGLDIGSRAVKMISLGANGDGCRVTAAAMSTIESTQGGEKPSRRAVIAAIEECLKSSGGSISRNSHFVFGLSGPKVKVSSFNFALLTLDEVADAVMFEAAQICPFDIRSSVVDYQLIDTDETGYSRSRKKKKVYPDIKGILAVAAKEEVSAKRILAKEALLKCVLMDSEGLALLNCLEKYIADNEELPVAVIDIGMSLITVAALGADGLPFIRNLSCCGKDIIDHISKGCGINADQVEHKLSGGKGLGGIDHACERLVHDINETLTYYSVNHGGDAIKHVYLCGGFSLSDSLVKVLVGGITSEVSVWNPFLRMDCDDNPVAGDLLRDCGAAFVVAAGLAMRQV